MRSIIGAAIAIFLFIGIVLWNRLSAQREHSETDQSHSDKLDYPTDTNQESSIAALARAQIALAKDTNAADKQQSSYNKRAHRISFWTAIGVGAYTVLTAILIIVSIVQFGYTQRFNKRQLGIIRDQLDAMRDEQRAWISLDTDIAGHPVGPLTFAERGATIQITAKMTNVGRTVARDVTFNADLIPTDATKKSLPYVIAVRNEECAGRPHATMPDAQGFILFQGQHATIAPWVTMDAQDVEIWKTPLDKKGYRVAVVAGCISYLIGTSSARHTTRFIFELDRLVPKLWTLIDPTKGDIPAAELLLSVNPSLPWQAD